MRTLIAVVSLIIAMTLFWFAKHSEAEQVHHKRGHQYDRAWEFRELDCGKMYKAIISIRRQIKLHESKTGRHKGRNGFLVRMLKEDLRMLENLYPYICEEV
jgi:hypothetical protein